MSSNTWRAKDRAVLTAEGIDKGIQGRAPTPYGTVVGYFPAATPGGMDVLEVRRDGDVQSYRWAARFWVKVPDAPAPAEPDPDLVDESATASVTKASALAGD